MKDAENRSETNTSSMQMLHHAWQRFNETLHARPFGIARDPENRTALPSTKQFIIELCRDVGITVNGDQPWDLRVHNERFYARVIADGSLGLGESYMLGWWDCDDLYGFFERLLSSKRLDGRRHVGWRTAIAYLQAKLLNVQSKTQSRELADTHYNISNELFEHMLGPSMAYSCAVWNNANNLDDAQTAKFDLICRKLHLTPGERLLDIGCGWGGLEKFAAENYGVEVVGLTVAEQQAAYAREDCAGLPVQIACCDYREFDHRSYGGPFDKIVSVGMIEHVGYRNYRKMFEIATSALRSRGLFLLHTIGSSVSLTAGDAWLSKYIFPGGVLPSMQQLSDAAEGLVVLHDAQNIGVNYTKTLLSWHRNFEAFWASQDWTSERPSIRGSNDTFYRMWRYYLLLCAADFKVGDSQVWQLVYAKDHLPSGYECVR